MAQAERHAVEPQHSKRVDAADVISAYLARVTYADLPSPVVTAVKACILDQLGCILSGTGCTDVVTLRTMAVEWGGAPTCTIIGSGGLRLPPMSAALVNGAAIHQYDFDDVHDRVTCHPTASTLVPSLAAAEEKGGVCGQDLILAVAAGSDLTCRVSRAIVGTHGHPWYRAPVVGMFGATAACAKIFGASEAEHQNAFGLALPQIGGTYASLHHHGSSIRSIRDGLAYRNGLLAAQMAMRGLQGDPEVLEGKFGFYQAYYKGSYDPGKLLAGLGDEFEATNVSLKPWPSARHLHTTITAVLDIVTRERLSFADVADVTFDVGRVNQDRCQPVSAEVADAHIDLLSNLPYSVAAAIRYGNVPLSAYIDHRQIAEVIRDALPKVHWRNNPEQDGEWRFEPGRVQLQTTDGRTFRELCTTALGHPDNPMSEAQQHDKFRRCASIAARPVEGARADAIIDAVANLDACTDVGELLKLLA